MSYQFIEVVPSSIVLDQEEVDRDDGFVYKHLKRYCTTFTPLPAITLKLIAGKLSIVQGHKYLSIARELGHKQIRAVLIDETFDQLKAQGIPGLLRAIPRSELEEELRTTVLTGWHIFFFKYPPSQKVAAEIDARFRRFLRESLPSALGKEMDIQIESHFDFSGPCLEINFPTPVTNEEWARSYRNLALSINAELVPIDTYQGRRFG